MQLMKDLIQLVQKEVSSGRLSMSELARRAGCTRQYLYQILREESDPTLPLAAKIAEACGFQVEIKKSREKKTA